MHALNPLPDEPAPNTSRSLAEHQLHRAACGAARLMAAAEQLRQSPLSAPLDLNSWVVDEHPRDPHVSQAAG